MAFLQYSISVVGLDKVRQAMRAVEAEAEGLGRKQLMRDPLGRRMPVGKGPRGANDNASIRTAEALYRRQERNQDRLNLAERRANERNTAAQYRQQLKAQKRLRGANDNAELKAAEADFRRRETYRARMRGANDNANVRAAATIAAAEEKARSSALQREERMRLRMADRVAQAEYRGRLATANTAKTVIGNTASKVAAIGKSAIALTGLGGGALFASSVHNIAAQHAQAADLANQLNEREATPQKLEKTKREVLSHARATRGFSTEQVLTSMSEFQATAGEAEATKRIAPVVTEMALASGATPEDIGKMDAAIYAGLRRATGGAEKSVTELIHEVERMNRVFAAMGQKGAIELKDLSVHGGELAMVSRQFGGDPVESLKQTGAWIQVVRQSGVVSAAEAATAIENLPNDLKTHAADTDALLKSKGLGSMFTDKTRQRFLPLMELMPKLVAATEGDIVKLGDITGIRGGRALQGYTTPFNEAFNAEFARTKDKKKARAAGIEAIHRTQNEFNNLEMSAAEVKTKADFRMAEPDKAFEAQMRNLQMVVGETLLPQLVALIPSIAKLVPYMGDLAEATAKAIKWISDSPWEAAFAGIGVILAAEIAKASIGGVISAGFTRLIAGVAPSAITSAVTAATAAAPAAVSAATAATTAATTAVSAATAATTAATTAAVTAGTTAATTAAAPAAAAGAAALLGPIGLGVLLGVATYAGISIGGRNTYDKANADTTHVMKTLGAAEGGDLEKTIGYAEIRLKQIKDEAGLFGSFMDLFGAGPEAEIKGLEAQIKAKKAEYEYWLSNGKRDTEDMRANKTAREWQETKGDGGVNRQEDLQVLGKAFDGAANKIVAAADRMAAAVAGGSPSTTLNTGYQPSQPTVK